MTGALEGLRVLDLGHYVAGPLAAMLLAEQGAEVIHVTPAGGERWAHPSNAYLQRMKRVVALDLGAAEGRAAVLSLLRDADVLIDNFRPGVIDRLGLVDAGRETSLVHLSLPGFAPGDRRAGLRAWEGIVGAATGLFTDVHVARQFLGLPPAFTALRLASAYGAVHGATAVLAALLRGGTRPARIHVPLADALFRAMGSTVMQVPSQPTRYDIPPVPRFVRDALLPLVRGVVRHASRRTQGFVEALGAKMLPPLMDSYRCQDGRWLYVFAMDHAVIPRRLAEVTGIAADLARRGLSFGGGREGSDVADAARLSRANREVLRELLGHAFARRTAFAWESALNEAGVPAAVQRSTSEWLDWEPVRASGLVVTVDDPELGLVAMPGRAVRVGDGPSSAATAPRSMVSSATWGSRSSSASWWPTAQRAPSGPMGETREGAAGALPLAGLSVVDMSSMVAGPIAARGLAELGARVWKIESPAPHHGPRMMRWYGIDVNQGKESVVLDLASDGGRAAVTSLLAQSDVLVHNLRPAASRACGVDDDALRAHAGLVVASIAAYGGPFAAAFDAWPGYDPVLQASTGIMMRYGSEARPELHAIASCVDYLAGDLLALGVLTSLHARASRRDERARPVRVSLAAAAQLAQVTLIVRSGGELPGAPHGQDASGLSATNRIFRAKDGYLYAVFGPAALERLGVGAKDLEAWVRARTSSAAVAELNEAGAAAHAVTALRDGVTETLTDPDVVTLGKGSHLAFLTDHPAGSRVATAFPAHVRAEPPLVRALAPAMRRGAAQGALAHALGIALADVARPDEPYLPG